MNGLTYYRNTFNVGVVGLSPTGVTKVGSAPQLERRDRL